MTTAQYTSPLHEWISGLRSKAIDVADVVSDDMFDDDGPTNDLECSLEEAQQVACGHADALVDALDEIESILDEEQA